MNCPDGPTLEKFVNGALFLSDALLATKIYHHTLACQKCSDLASALKESDGRHEAGAVLTPEEMAEDKAALLAFIAKNEEMARLIVEMLKEAFLTGFECSRDGFNGLYQYDQCGPDEIPLEPPVIEDYVYNHGDSPGLIGELMDKAVARISLKFSEAVGKLAW